MNFAELQALDQQYVAQTYGRFPIGIASGKGARFVDVDGKPFIDFTSGIGVNSFGFCDEGWVAAVTKQLCTLQHTSNLYYSEPYALLAKDLCERAGMKRVFFANSGAESNEGAIKCARKYSYEKYGEGRSVVVTLQNSFHGRTVTTLAATGQDQFHRFFFPFTEGFRYAPANDWSGTQALLTGDVCALMLEMVQGEGGVLPLSPAYVHQASEYCAAHDILLIVDEVQTGVGRTGSLFAYQQYGITPDIATAAKGLGGGLPIGAVMFGEKTQEVLKPGDHAATFGGNPAVCAGARYILDKIDGPMLTAVRKKGEWLKARIKAMPHVTDVSGMGLMLGVTLEGAKAPDIVRAGIDKGILLLTAKEKLRLLPPLVIEQADLVEGMDILEAILKAV